MKKKTRKNAITIISVLLIISLLFVVYGVSQIYINPSSKVTGLVQCTGTAARYWDGDYVGQQACGMAYWNLAFGGVQTCTDPDGCINHYPIASKEVSINTGVNNYRFVSTFGTGTTFGCTDYSNPHNYKNQQIEIYKEGALIKTLKTWQPSPTSQYPNHCSRGTFPEEYTIIDDIGSEIIITQTEGYQTASYWMNKYDLQLSDNIVDVVVETSQQSIVEGQDIVVNINVKNNINQDIRADLTVVFETPSIFGTVSKEQKLTQILNQGDNVITFDVPSDAPVEKLYVKPTLVLSMKGDNFPELNFLGNPTKDLEWVELKTIVEETVLVSIAPQPLFLNSEGDSCTLGYELSPDEEYCVRDDVRELTCAVIGCPTIVGHDYTCTSYGICAETVFEFKDCETDLDCPNKTTCDANTGLCIRSEIIETILSKDCTQDNDCPGDATCEVDSGLCFKNGETFSIQCIEKEDCVDPCVGISAECNQFGMCVYNGECLVQEVGCKEYGCGEDYVCNEELNICEKPPLSWQVIVGLIFIISITSILGYIVYKKIRK